MFSKNLVKRREWKDLGEKPNKSSMVLGGLPSSKPYYPSLYLNSKQVGILPIEAGEEVTLIIRAKATSINISSSEINGDSASYSFDLLKMKLSKDEEEEEGEED